MVIVARENIIGARLFLIGVILAVIVGVITRIPQLAERSIDPIILGVLAVLGIIVGYFVAAKDVKTFLMAAVSVVIVSFAGIQGLVLNAAILGLSLNKIITSILGALLFLFIPATIIVAMKTVFAISKS